MLGSALGQFPLGGFGAADSLSVADPLAGLITDPLAQREFLLRAEPLDSLGSPVAVDLSGGGFVSRSTDTPFKHFHPALGRPGDFSVSLPVPALHGGTQAGIGAVTANNPDALRDADAELDWLGVDEQVLLGPKDGSLSDFTPVLRGPGAGVSRGLDDLTIMFRDVKFRLQRALQPKKYGGFGAAVRGDGVTANMNGSVTCPAGSMTLQFRVRPVAVNSGVTGIAGWQATAGSGAGDRFVWWSGAGTLKPVFLLRNDAGTLFTVTSATGLVVGETATVTCVVDTAAAVARLYVDGVEQTAGTALTGTFATQPAAADFRFLATKGSGSANVDGDEISIWNTARTATQTLDVMDQQLEGSEAGLVYHNTLSEGAGTTAAPTTGTGTLTLNGGASIQWVGSLEGDASLVGNPKPIAVGRKRQVKPVWVDTQNGVYQFHDGEMNGVLALRDSGDPFVFGADLADIYSAAPASTDYNTCLAKGLVRVGRAPVGIITGDIEGDSAGGKGYDATAPGIAHKVLTQWCAWTDFDEAAFARLLAQDSSVNGFWWGGEITRDAALQEVFSSIWAWWGPDRIGRITCGRISAPESEIATVNLTRTDLIEPTKGGRFRVDPVSVRVGEVRVLYRPYQTVLSDEQVAGVVPLAERKDFGTEYRIARAVNHRRSEDADEVEVRTSIDERADAEALAQYILAVLSVDRTVTRISLEGGLLSYFIGTVVQLTLDRYSFSAGKKTVVVRLSEFYGDSASSDRVEVDLFG